MGLRPETLTLSKDWTPAVAFRCGSGRPKTSNPLRDGNSVRLVPSRQSRAQRPRPACRFRPAGLTAAPGFLLCQRVR
jgi:hypothetical protein